MKRVSVVVLNFNTERDTVSCLKSLTKVDYPDFEVVVVENGSDENSVRELSKHIAKLKHLLKLRVVRLSKNLGYAGGCNAGVRETRSDYVVLLTNDTIVNRNYLKALVETFERYEKVGVVVPKIVHKGYYQDNLTFNGLMSISGLPIEFLPGESQSFFSSVSGCSLLFDKRVFELPFDDDYFLCLEDAYLSWSSLLQGYKCVPSLEAVLTHKSLYHKDRSGSFNIVFHPTKNIVMNVLIFFELVNLFKVLPLLFVQSFLILVLPLFRMRPRGVWWKLRSYWWLLRNFDRVWRKRKYVQSLRRISDRDLSWGFTCRQPFFKGFFGRFIDSLIFLYCWLLRLPVREVYRDAK